jgi:Pyruvate phosphate dikinase, AMP/ATP-binding domain/Cyclic nucleotide-binding domain
VAGVLFTQNPITGADERMVEASWGLGEAVVAGLVIPDHFRISREGAVLERTPGRKQVAVRSTPAGGTVEEAVPSELVGAVCLDTAQLAQLGELATRCEDVYGTGRDIEFAFAAGQLYLLQCRAVTTVGPSTRQAPRSADEPVRADALKPVALFSELDDDERAEVAGLFKARHFTAGEVVIREGTGGAAFFLIEAGEAAVSVGGEERRVLGPGDSFGEIALVDDGPRSATVTARTDLECQGITFWDFRPLVEGNGRIGWKLLQSMVRKLRDAEAASPPAG